MLNPDKKFVKEIQERIEANGGFCPCRFDRNEDTICPCKFYREDNECICGLYVDDIVKEKVSEGENND